MKDPVLLPSAATSGRTQPPRHKQRFAELAKPLTHELRVNPPAIVTERELSHITGLCGRSIRNYVRAGFIPRIKIGRRVLFRWPQVEAALAKL